MPSYRTRTDVAWPGHVWPADIGRCPPLRRSPPIADRCWCRGRATASRRPGAARASGTVASPPRHCDLHRDRVSRTHKTAHPVWLWKGPTIWPRAARGRLLATQRQEVSARCLRTISSSNWIASWVSIAACRKASTGLAPGWKPQRRRVAFGPTPPWAPTSGCVRAAVPTSARATAWRACATASGGPVGMTSRRAGRRDRDGAGGRGGPPAGPDVPGSVVTERPGDAGPRNGPDRRRVAQTEIEIPQGLRRR